VQHFDSIEVSRTCDRDDEVQAGIDREGLPRVPGRKLSFREAVWPEQHAVVLDGWLYLVVSRESFASSFRLCSSYSAGVIASESRSSASFLSWSSGSVGGCDDSATPPATLEVTPIRRNKSPIASLVFFTTSTARPPPSFESLS
jgi:hypothetical protein